MQHKNDLPTENAFPRLTTHFIPSRFRGLQLHSQSDAYVATVHVVQEFPLRDAEERTNRYSQLRSRVCVIAQMSIRRSRMALSWKAVRVI